ncbi:MAG: 3-deoxy-manno-octulosonate cytidylyltransferase [Brachymonas sp.]|nr:3-deoxy-manno-octulosonate cytidylyltransferase [Brachymonas sp.]
MTPYTILIPARLHSTRLPEKPLADIAGAPMIVRVAQRVQQADAAHAAARVVVAADHERIVQACQRFGVEAILTSAHHASGSDRLAQACELLQLPDAAIVVNVQGDEPLIDPALPAAVAQQLARTPNADMATAAHPLHTAEEWGNPNVVKVVCNVQQLALYFSRAPIPCWRDAPAGALPDASPAAPLRHIGIYAYRVAFLKRFPQLPQAPLEQAESLEQLRALWHGHAIAVHITPHAPGRGVDTPEDLAAVRAQFAA